MIDPLDTATLDALSPPAAAATPRKKSGKQRGPGNGARSLAHLRKLGYVAGVVERWNAHAGVRQDLFGFIDIVACKPGEVLFVQTTSAAGIRDHIEKVMRHDNYAAVKASGARIVIHGWSKMANRWHLREVDVT